MNEANQLGAAGDAGSLELPPAALADTMLALAHRGTANLVVLQPGRARGPGGTESYTLLVKRGSATVGRFTVAPETANAAVARLALLGKLDPLGAEAALRDDVGEHLGGPSAVARIPVSMDGEVSELLLSVAANPDGMEAEIRPYEPRELRGGSPGQLRRCPQCGALFPWLARVCEADGAPLEEVHDDPRPGGFIGVYRLGERLGIGGMGEVLSAEHALIGRPVAIKVMLRSLADNPAMARRFLVEARAASRVRHPSVIDVTDFGVLTDGRPYLVMERLEGEPLSARALREGRLAPRAALLIGREVALALAAAHAQGIVHGDLKPENVLLLEGSTDETPRLKLVDFGAAFIADAGGGPDSDGQRDDLVGTPGYMAPERLNGERADCRSDLYALGAMLFEMLDERVPAHRTTSDPVIDAEWPRDPARLPLPQAVLRLLARALRERADERHQSAAEALVDLDAAIQALSRDDWRSILPS